VLDHALTGREVADDKPWIESELQRPKTSDDEPETSDKDSDMGEDESRTGEADSDMRDNELHTIADDFETSSILVHVFKFIEKEFFARHPNLDDLPGSRALLRFMQLASLCNDHESFYEAHSVLRRMGDLIPSGTPDMVSRAFRHWQPPKGKTMNDLRQSLRSNPMTSYIGEAYNVRSLENRDGMYHWSSESNKYLVLSEQTHVLALAT
jgi:hypothetical protein